MNKKNKEIGHLSNREKLYRLKVGNIGVEIDYSKNGKKIDECMLNILKQKMER